MLLIFHILKEQDQSMELMLSLSFFSDSLLLWMADLAWQISFEQKGSMLNYIQVLDKLKVFFFGKYQLLDDLSLPQRSLKETISQKNLKNSEPQDCIMVHTKASLVYVSILILLLAQIWNQFNLKWKIIIILMFRHLLWVLDKLINKFGKLT